MRTNRKSRTTGRHDGSSRTKVTRAGVARIQAAATRASSDTLDDWACCYGLCDARLDDFNEQEEGAAFKAWLAKQVEVYAGHIAAQEVAAMTSVWPDWLERRARFYLGLSEQWSSSRLGGFIGFQIDAYDSGTLPTFDQERMDQTLPGWRSHAARSFCGRPMPD